MLRLIRSSVHQIERGVSCFPDKRAEIVVAVIRDLPGFILDGERIIDADFRTGRKIVEVHELLVADFLDAGILRGVDPQTAGIDRPEGLSIRVAEFCLQIFDNLSDQSVLIVAVDRDGTVSRLLTLYMDAGVDVILKGFIVILQRDITLIQHGFEHKSASGGIV